MKQRVNKILCLLLSLVMLLSIMPISAFASEWHMCVNCESYYQDEEDVCSNCRYCAFCWQDTHCQYCTACVGEDGLDDICEYCERCVNCATFELKEAAGLDVTMCDECITDSQNFSGCLNCGKYFPDLAENEYCVECCRCSDCWEPTEHCVFCGCEGDICDTCYVTGAGVCLECHEQEDFLCDEDSSHCLVVNTPDHVVNSTHHCILCCIECPDCGECSLEKGDYCEDCERCVDCKIDYQCVSCGDCTSLKESCIDGSADSGEQWCLDCCMSEGNHCNMCELHVFDWCPTGDIGSHCAECSEELTCIECGTCTECADTELCDTCGLCIECCEKNSEEAECECGLCVEDPGFATHANCAECEKALCGANEACEFCLLCVECCDADNKCKHGFCKEDNEHMVAHTCTICKKCFADSELCDSCTATGDAVVCKACCKDQSGCGHNICINDEKAWVEHWCFKCNNCFSNCPHEYSTGTNNHPATPTNVLIHNGTYHWYKCKFCDSYAHGASFAQHTYVRGKCSVCGCGKDEGKPPRITIQPKTQKIVSPVQWQTTSPAVFTIETADTATYQWQRVASVGSEGTVWKDIPGATKSTYTTRTYTYADRLCKTDKMTLDTLRCKVTNEFGTTYSREVKLRVEHNQERFDWNGDDNLSGMHWKACASCSSGTKKATATPHTGTWTYNSSDGKYYRTCTDCKVTESRLKDTPYIITQPKSQTIECPTYLTIDDVEYVTFEVQSGSDFVDLSKLTYTWYEKERNSSVAKQLTDDAYGYIKGSNTAKLTLKINSEACEYTKNSNGLYGSYFCVIKGPTGSDKSNPATLRINHNDDGWGFLPQNNNYVWKVYPGDQDLYNKHWPACSGYGDFKGEDSICAKNAKYRLAEPHEMGEWRIISSGRLRYCEVCSYREYYANGQACFVDVPETIHISNANIGDKKEFGFTVQNFDKTKTLNALWVQSELTTVDGRQVFRTWEVYSSPKTYTTTNKDELQVNHTINITKNSCKISQEVSAANKYFCMIKQGGTPDPTKPTQSLSSSAVKVIIDHNQNKTEFDDTHHWKKCSICDEYVDNASKVPHTFGEWEKADKGGYVRKCTGCDAQQTTNNKPEEKPVPFKLSFGADIGLGTMAPLMLEAKKAFRLPKCEFIAPYGKRFKAWSVDGVEKEAGSPIILSKDTLITAIWEDIPPTSEHVCYGGFWDYNGTHHWKMCTSSTCPVENESKLPNYAPHTYSSKFDNSCNDCGFTRTICKIYNAQDYETAKNSSEDYDYFIICGEIDGSGVTDSPWVFTSSYDEYTIDLNGYSLPQKEFSIEVPVNDTNFNIINSADTDAYIYGTKTDPVISIRGGHASCEYYLNVDNVKIKAYAKANGLNGSLIFNDETCNGRLILNNCDINGFYEAFNGFVLYSISNTSFYNSEIGSKIPTGVLTTNYDDIPKVQEILGVDQLLVVKYPDPETGWVESEGTLNITDKEDCIGYYFKPYAGLDIGIDYENEELTGFSLGGYYGVNDDSDSYDYIQETTKKIDPTWFGTTIKLEYINSSNTNPVINIVIPARPVIAQSDFTFKSASSSTASDGKFLVKAHITAPVEYSLDNGTTWKAVTADGIGGIAAGASVLVRQKAVAGKSFMSEAITLTMHKCATEKIAKVNATHFAEGKNEYYKCSTCGNCYEDAAGTKTIADINTWGIIKKTAHDFTPANCTAPKTCKIAGCGHTEGKALGHSGGNATCTKKAICGVCGVEYGELKAHSYSDTWKYDKNNHWKECTCGNKTNATAHTPSDWIVEKAATADAEGLEIKKCTVCGAKLEERAIPKLTPEYVLGDINGDNKVTATDARLILRIATKLEKLENQKVTVFAAADVNGDGKITATDARKILRVATKLEKF